MLRQLDFGASSFLTQMASALKQASGDRSKPRQMYAIGGALGSHLP